MPLDPTIKDEIEAIGKELVASGVLNPEERANCLAWTVALGKAAIQGEAAQVANYRAALNAMLGVAELRAASAAEKALLRMATLGVSILTKVIAGL